MDYRTKILEFMEYNGPALPVHIGKLLGKEILLASAMLSEMASKGLVKISHIKVGGSPLYYKPGHEAKLIDFTTSLNDKEKPVFDLLQSNIILEDVQLTPLQRVVLHSLKDFAVPIILKTNEGERKFWKWFLCPDEEAKERIIKIVTPPAEKKPEPQAVAEEPEEKSQKKESKSKAKKEGRQKTLVQKSESLQGLPTKKEESKQKQAETSAVQLDDAAKQLFDFFKTQSIDIVEQLPTDGKDRDFIIEFKGPFGKQRAFCRAIIKKKIAEVDLQAAVLRSLHNRLPLVVLYEGTLARNAEVLLAKDSPGAVLKKIM